MNWIFLVKGILLGISIFASLLMVNKLKNSQGNTLWESLTLSVLIPVIVFL